MFKRTKNLLRQDKKKLQELKDELSCSDEVFCKSEIAEQLIMECCCNFDCDPFTCESMEFFQFTDYLTSGCTAASDYNNNTSDEKMKIVKPKKVRKKKVKKKICKELSSHTTSTSSVNSLIKSKKIKKKIGCVPGSPSSSQSSTSTPTTVLQKPPCSFPNDEISNQLKYSTGKSFSANDLSGMKGSMSLRKPRPSRKSPKLCGKFTKEILADFGFQNLCDRFKSSSLTNLVPITPATTVKSLVQLSDHDRKILDRMSMKRTKEIEMMEDAAVARKYWELEKNERHVLRNKQLEDYFKSVQMKRQQEQLELERRKQILAEREKEYSEKVKQEINAKTIKAENILKNIEMEREISECKKRHREFMRIESILANFEEHRLNEDIWRQELHERMEQRINKAEHVRNKIMDIQKVRIQTDNQIEQQLHAANLDQTKKIEEFKTEKLKEKIVERDSKYRRFAEQKRRVVEESQNQAKTSALLRELVRRSFSTDCFRTPVTPSQQRSYSSVDRRPISNMSYHSQISHIHLS